LLNYFAWSIDNTVVFQLQESSHGKSLQLYIHETLIIFQKVWNNHTKTW